MKKILLDVIKEQMTEDTDFIPVYQLHYDPMGYEYYVIDCYYDFFNDSEILESDYGRFCIMVYKNVEADDYYDDHIVADFDSFILNNEEILREYSLKHHYDKILEYHCDEPCHDYFPLHLLEYLLLGLGTKEEYKELLELNLESGIDMEELYEES